MVRTLLHRAETIVTEEEDKQREIEHVKSALRTNGYPEWIFRIPRKKSSAKAKDRSTTAKKPSAGMPYIRGTSEVLQRTFRKYGANIYHKPYNTVRQQVTRVRDRTDKMKKCGVIYHIKCDSCEGDYVGETARQLNIRLKEPRILSLKEHMSRSSSAIYEHCEREGHKIRSENTKVLMSEDNFWKRKVKEAVEIRQRRPSLNRDEGLELPRVYDSLLTSCDPSPVT